MAQEQTQLPTQVWQALLLTRQGLASHGYEGLRKHVDGLPAAPAGGGAAVAAHAALQHLAEAGPARRQPLGWATRLPTLLNTPACQVSPACYRVATGCEACHTLQGTDDFRDSAFSRHYEVKQRRQLHPACGLHQQCLQSRSRDLSQVIAHGLGACRANCKTGLGASVRICREGSYERPSHPDAQQQTTPCRHVQRACGAGCSPPQRASA